MPRSCPQLSKLILTTITFVACAAHADFDPPAPASEPRFPTCEGEILSLPRAAYAARVRSDFRDLEIVRERIERAREYGHPYLSESEMEWLPRAMKDLDHGVEYGRYNRREYIATLLNAAEDNLVRDFVTHVDQVERDLITRADQALEQNDTEHYDWLAELITRVDHYRRGISIENGAWYWQHARFEAAQLTESEPDPLLPMSIAAAREGIAFATPSLTGGNFEFVRTLNVMKSKVRTYDLRTAFHRAVGPIDSLTTDTTPPAYRTAFVPDLDRALSFFIDPPRPSRDPSRLTLEGLALINGVATPISVAFDARVRYFTVRTLSSDLGLAQYYQMILRPDGILEFVDAAPVRAAVAHRRLDLTHFAF